MKTGYRLLTEEVFSRNIHLLNIERSESDKSLVNIILTLSEGNVDSFIPTIQVNNDVRKYIYSLNNRIEIKKLSCGHQGIESQNSLYIQFNLDLNDNDLSDDFIYKLSCHLGLKYKCHWCSYIFQGKIRNIQLHY